MTETVSNIFDVATPSPVTLQELSSIVIVAELWRKKIRACLRKCILNKITLPWGIWFERVLPNLPRRFYSSFVEYSGTSRCSIDGWLEYHSIKVFNTSFRDANILRIFDDFAWDWNGAIHYVYTAKRMLWCDRIDDYEKFRIACLYCFEDDIKQIWPFVCAKMDLNEIDFQTRPQLYYWICYLRNEMHKVPNPRNEPIDEMMINKCEPSNYSLAEYFWNRIPIERRSPTFIVNVSRNNPELFARFILPKLNEQQLVRFLAERCVNFMKDLLTNRSPSREALVPSTWMYIKNKIDESIFIALIEELLLAEATFFRREPWLKESVVYKCCGIWKNAAQNFKQSALRSLFPDGQWIRRIRPTFVPREMKFVITVLSDADFETRSAFWRQHWSTLILSACEDDVLEMMKLCFGNEEEIDLFKENTMFNDENIRPYLDYMLGHHLVRDANKFLSFCNSDELERFQLKRRFLMSNFHAVLAGGRSPILNFLIDEEEVVNFMNDVV